MTVLRSLLLFAVAALAEIGGAWLIWQGVREHRGVVWIGAGVLALGAYGFVATLQPDANFGRILAAYGGIFVAGSLAWGMAIDKFQPVRWDITGAAICLLGVAVIMYPHALDSPSVGVARRATVFVEGLLSGGDSEQRLRLVARAHRRRRVPSIVVPEVSSRNSLTVSARLSARKRRVRSMPCSSPTQPVPSA